MGRLTFYLASRYSRREELLGYKADLEARGHRVPARWLLGEHQVHGVEAARAVEAPGQPVPAREARLFAQDDIEDLVAADVVVSFTEPPRVASTSRGGRHVEFGIALGLCRAGRLRRLIVVGPLENVFHAVPEVEAFDDWRAFMAHFDVLPSIHGWDISGRDRCDAHPWHMSGAWHRAAWTRRA